MKYIRKLWSRLLISLVGGSFATELLVISTGKGAIRGGSMMLLLIAALIFSILSGIVFFEKYKYYWFDYKESKESREDVLDDDL